METVKIYIENINLQKKYVFEFISMTLGVKLICARDTADKDIRICYSSSDLKMENCIQIDDRWSNEPVYTSTDGISKQEEGHFQFDVIHSIWELISDQVNKTENEAAYDSNQRLRLEYSFQYLNGVVSQPLVNMYVDHLERKLNAMGIKTSHFIPNPYKALVCLTHDVDFPDKYAIRYSPWYIKKSGISKHLLMYRKKFNATFRRLMDKSPDNHWLFEDIMSAELMHGFRSSFYFAPVSKFDGYGHPQDVNYNINNRRFVEVMKRIQAMGFEVGLHASYNAYQETTRFIEEKKTIDNRLLKACTGLRHHGWHLGLDIEGTLIRHEDSGFQYDTSIAFPNNIGFRRSVSLPFFPWNSERGKALNVIQLPTFCMDAHLFVTNKDVDSAFALFKNNLENIKRYKGIGIVDWHVRTSYPTNNGYALWGETYLSILKYLSSEQDVLVITCGELASEYNARKEKLLPIVFV